MSQIEADALTAEIVAQYLAEHPDFFLNRRELVDRLSLPHQEQGAVPLALVQMNRQRRRIEELEEDITGLMSLAANNDKTFHEFMSLQEQVLKCEALVPAFAAIKAMAKDLNLSAYVRLLDTPDDNYLLSQEAYQRFSTNHLNGKSAYLGRLRKADRHALFGETSSAPEMGSYVVLPLYKGKTLGLLAFSSDDGGHFQPHMDTLFLRHLALVLSHLIVTLPWQDADERLSSRSL
ncbi:hypothetical protein SAMN04488136_13410 [Vibrio xiamenensis]|uniref:3',5'-cyclic-nucleotide phosphodiesterase n=1 Tax=Vibrio xiamenensis TaxID=861298 RepID=A0A1G8G282_9VIBR|nr:DUF484 family protein [Vibrio xiamenensis]SDH88400.1 hypothetical protein SAMN04488136_13410 [Vibrio xiamenensis]